MAGEAGQAALAAPKARAGSQHERLMAGVPWIAQNGRLPGRGGCAVTLSAKTVELIGGKPAGVLRAILPGLPDMRGGGTVADFAAHA